MAGDDTGGAKPAGPVVLRIKLRYDDVETMVQRFAPNVGKSGLFLPTKSIQPIGTEVKFELRLANDTAVLVGLGRVKHVRPPDPSKPKAAFGMAVELTRVSREGREVIIKMIERRRAMGLPDVAIPVPDDLEASRRVEVETQPRIDTSGVVREAITQFASEPVAEQVLASAPPTGPVAVVNESGPVAVVKETGPTPIAKETAAIAKNDRASAPLMTAPRAPSGPIAIVRDEASGRRFAAARDEASVQRSVRDQESGRRSVPALAPERAKTRRPRIADVIEKANESSGPLASAPDPGLDEQVDVERALSRARALAGGDLEVELAALRESSAAPVEISIEAASAELARQLGGKAIAKRERSARWAPPPAVEMRSAPSTEDAGTRTKRETAEFDSKTRAETEAAPSATIAAVTAAASAAYVDIGESNASAPAYVDPAQSGSPEFQLPDEERHPDELSDDPQPVSRFREDEIDEVTPPPGSVYVIRSSGTIDAAYDSQFVADPALQPEPYDAANERTRIPSGVEDYVEAFRPSASAVTAIEPEAVADPMLIDDNADIESFERALDAARLHTGVSKVAPPRPGEENFDDDFDESTQIGAMPVDPNAFGAHGYPTMPDQLAEQLDRQLAEAEREADADFSIGLREPAPGYDPYGEQSREQGYSNEAQPSYANEDYAQQGHGYADDPNDAQQGYAQPQPGYAESSDGDVDDGEEISDLDVLAIADEGDADLLNAHGEADASGRHEVARPAPAPVDDFAARLDLGDDPEPEPSHRRRHVSHHPAVGPPPASEFPDPPSNSYTFAEPFPQAGIHFAPHESGGEDFDEPHSYTSPPIEPPPQVETERPRRSRRQSTDDLEDALAALDVNLDDGSYDQQRVRRTTGQRPLPGLPEPRPPTGEAPIVRATPRTVAHTVRRAPAATREKPPTQPPPIPAAARTKPPTEPAPVVRAPTKRATTDDGVLIDFDDDE